MNAILSLCECFIRLARATVMLVIELDQALQCLKSARGPDYHSVSLTHPGWLYLIRMATLESDRRVAWFRQETRAVWPACSQRLVQE